MPFGSEEAARSFLENASKPFKFIAINIEKPGAAGA
jgi:hypothetical protein